MINVVDVLIKKVDSLTIFLHDELRTFNLSLLIPVWNNENIFKGCFSNGLSIFRKHQLLSTNQLNLILFIVAELNAVLAQLKWRGSRVLIFIVIQIVLGRHLIFGDLENWVGVSSEETLLLSEHFRSSGKSKAAESCLCSTDMLSNFQVWGNTCLLDHFHLIDVENHQALNFYFLLWIHISKTALHWFLSFFVLVNEWDELKLGLIVEHRLKGEQEIISLRLFLLLNQVLEGHFTGEAINDFLFA